MVAAPAQSEVRAFLASDFARELLAAGSLPRTEVQSGTEAGTLVLQHERIPFISYPYEWPAEMLSAAGALTLDIALAGIESDWGLKDATPFNVLFRGPRPVFVDILSFERRQPKDSIWIAYAQFVRTFLLPLLIERDHGVPASRSLAGKREGPEPIDLYRLASPLRRLTPPYLTLAALPVWLGGGGRRSQGKPQTTRAQSAQQARFILRTMFKGLQRTLRRVSPKAGQVSTWSGYASDLPGYSEASFAAKDEFVSAALARVRPVRVLDVGANTGHFSVTAARSGAEVVAVDSDPVSIGALWRRARDGQLNILPLVIDLADPTPAAGWRNVERTSFLARASQHFDLVLMLGVVHHLLVTDRIPLAEIVGLMAELTTRYVIVEYIGPDDIMFRQIVRGREALHSDLNADVFEAACRAHFVIESSLPLPGGTRTLYLLRSARA